MSESHAHDGPHILPVSDYLKVFGALMVLTVLTVFVATINLGALNNIAMLGIAIVKALLVVTIFMHLRWSPKIVWIVAGGSVIWLLILFTMTLSDLMTRGWFEQYPAGWL